MSVSAGARRDSSEGSRITESLLRNEQDFIQRMKPFNASAPGQGPATSGEMTGSNPLNMGMAALANVGAQIDGALAYLQNDLLKDVDDAIKVGRGVIDGVFTSFGNLSDAINDDILDIIDGGDFDGQIMKLLVPDGISNYTVQNRNNGGNSTGNIFMSGTADLTAQGGDVMEFVFDAQTTPPSMVREVTGIPGVWRLSSNGSGSGSGGGEFFGPWTANHDAGGFSLNNILSLDIEDSAGDTGMSISAPLGVGGRITFNNTESLFITQNITNIAEFDSTGIKLLGNNITVGTGGQIVAGGAGFGMALIGHLDFIDNLATPAATFSIYSDGTDLLANTGSRVTNLDDTALKASNNTFVGTNIFTTQTTFTDNIVAGGAGDGVTNIGNLTFVDNLATPVATFAIFSDGTDLFANTGSKTVNLDEIPDLAADETVTGEWTFDDNINAGGAGFGMITIGHLDFVDNLATPAATFSIYSDGTDLFANTGSRVTNLDDTALKAAGNVFTGSNIFSLQTVFTSNIVGGGAGDGMTNIGNLVFVDNLATPGGIAIYSDGTDIFTTATWNFNLQNLENITDITLRSGFNTSKLFFDGGFDTYITGSGASGRINIITNNDITMHIQDGEVAILNDAHLRFTERAGDPTQVANASLIYSKDVSTVTHLFTRDSDGTVHDLSAGGGGEFFGPWTGTHDAGDQNLDDLNILTMNGDGSGIQSIDFINFFNAGSVLNMGNGLISTVDTIDMNGGGSRIQDLDDLDFQGSGSTLVQLDTLTMLDSGSRIDMNFGDIFDVAEVGVLNHQVEFDTSHIGLFVFGSSDFVSFDDGTGPRIRYDYDTDDFFPVDSVANLGRASNRWVTIYADNALNVSFTEFKQNIVELGDNECMAVCAALPTIEFEWKDDRFKQVEGQKVNDKIDLMKGKRIVGFNADALKTMLPNATEGDMMYPNAVIGILLGAVRHLKARIVELETP